MYMYLSLSLYIYIYTYICVCMYVCIYIYSQRERSICLNPILGSLTRALPCAPTVSSPPTRVRRCPSLQATPGSSRGHGVVQGRDVGVAPGAPGGRACAMETPAAAAAAAMIITSS